MQSFGTEEIPIFEQPRERPLHALTITPFYPRAEDRTNGCFVAEPLAELSRQGLRTTIAAVEGLYRRRPVKDASAPDADWFRYPALPSGLGLASAGIGLYLRLRPRVGELHARVPIDVIHAHGALPCGHAALLLSRRFGIPFVVTVHGRDAFSSRQVPGWPGAWCERVSRRVFSAARQVIGVSQRVCDEVRGGMRDGVRCVVVYNGADPSVFGPGDHADPFLLLSVGNLIGVKGHALVVRAMSALRAEFPQLAWEVIGEGPELASLRQLADRLNVLDRIRFRGRQDRVSVAEAYRRCTLFVLPSNYEGLGCVYLEAMSSGKVAVGCTGQGIEEIVRHGENGWLVPPNGDAELVEGLRVLLRDDGLRKGIGCAARATILQSFTVEHQAQRLLQLYRECTQ